MPDLASIVNQATNQSGWAGVGQNIGGLAGAGGTGNAAYTAGASQGLDLVKKQLEARKLRDEAVARDSMIDRLSKLPGFTPEMADAADALIQTNGGGDFNSFTSGMGNLQEQGFRQQAVDAPTIDAANTPLRGVATGPIKRTEVADGNQYDPYAPPGSNLMAVTPSAAADDARAALRVPAQNARDAAAAEKYRTGGTTRKTDDPITKANTRIVNGIIDEYNKKIIKDPTNREALSAERDELLRPYGAAADAAITMSAPMRAMVDDENAAREAKNLWPMTEKEAADFVKQYETTGVATSSVNDKPASEVRNTLSPNPSGKPKPASKAGVDMSVFTEGKKAISSGRDRSAVIAKMRAAGYNREADVLENETR